MLRDAIAGHKEEATVNLAHYVAKASKSAVASKNPLEIARKVRDVSQVYKNIFPTEGEEGLIEEAILVTGGLVKDNPKEMLADVREILPNQ